MRQPLGDWQAQIYRAYTTFGIRRFIPDIDLPDINPEFEEEHPRKEKGHGKVSGRFEKKPRASTDDDDEPRADLDYDVPESPPETGVDDATYDMQTAQHAGYAIQKTVARHGLVATPVVKDNALEIELHDEEGNYAGNMIRRYEYDQAEHEEFMLEEAFQGNGVGTDVQEALEDFYRERGITDIALLANADVGGYAWAKAGYQFSDPEDLQRILEKAEGMIQEQLQGRDQQLRTLADMKAGNRPDISPEIQAHFEKIWPDAVDQAAFDEIAKLKKFVMGGGLPAPIEFAMIGHIEGLETWFGKELMLGTTWSGRKAIR